MVDSAESLDVAAAGLLVHDSRKQGPRNASLSELPPIRKHEDTMITYFPQTSIDVEAECNDLSEKPATPWAQRSIGKFAALMNAAQDRMPPNRFNPRRELPGHAVIACANEAFGFDGWSSDISDLQVKSLQKRDFEEPRHDAEITVLVRVTLRDGTYQESQGAGFGRNMPAKRMAIEKAKKEAVTDALRKCMDDFLIMIQIHEKRVRSGYYR